MSNDSDSLSDFSTPERVMLTNNFKDEDTLVLKIPQWPAFKNNASNFRSHLADNHAIGEIPNFAMGGVVAFETEEGNILPDSSLKNSLLNDFRPETWSGQPQINLETDSVWNNIVQQLETQKNQQTTEINSWVDVGSTEVIIIDENSANNDPLPWHNSILSVDLTSETQFLNQNSNSSQLDRNEPKTDSWKFKPNWNDFKKRCSDSTKQPFRKLTRWDRQKDSHINPTRPTCHNTDRSPNPKQGLLAQVLEMNQKELRHGEYLQSEELQREESQQPVYSQNEDLRHHELGHRELNHQGSRHKESRHKEDLHNRQQLPETYDDVMIID